VVDGKDLSRVVAAGSPRLKMDEDGTARLTVEMIGTDLDVDLDGAIEVAQKTEPAEVRTVVLAKPGDLLLIGNCGVMDDITADQARAGKALFAELGIKVVIFADDIDLAKLPADA
jgi:hypothetical protein